MALRNQLLVHASSPIKIRQSLLASATVDALGGPAEFRTRFSFPLITTMVPNSTFGLQPGVWTDDTSMTLCLARSLARYTPPLPNTTNAEGDSDRDASKGPGGFDEADQLETYTLWRDRGYLSAIDSCFDIGGTIQRALTIWSNCHSPSLMRITPIGLAYWRDEEKAREYARRSSDVTHPNRLCAEACELWTKLIVRIMNEAVVEGEKPFSKLDLLKEIATFPYTHTKLRDALTVPSSAPTPPEKDVELEAYYCEHHPLLALISQCSSTMTEPISPYLTTPIPPAKVVPSTGYVLHTLVAALYAFFATVTFEEGAIMVVNMGNDADTVGAVYAGLAGCWYGSEEEGVLFRTHKVNEWMAELVKRDLVEEVEEELIQFSERLT